jgi:hypothetical protein
MAPAILHCEPSRHIRSCDSLKGIHRYLYSLLNTLRHYQKCQLSANDHKMRELISYSTFNAGLDWHFKRKHHLLFLISPNQTTRTEVLQQTITFKNQTFESGSSVTGQLRNYSFAPGYRYDIIHRPSGHLGIIVQFNLLDIKASITGTVIQPGQSTVATSSGTLFAPLPVAGPDGRIYFARNRVYVDGNLKGMYFFGYGNFISTAVKVGVRLGHHVDVTGGYELGSHLAIHGTSNRLDIRQTQRGPTAGLTFTF